MNIQTLMGVGTVLKDSRKTRIMVASGEFDPHQLGVRVAGRRAQFVRCQMPDSSTCRMYEALTSLHTTLLPRPLLLRLFCCQGSAPRSPQALPLTEASGYNLIMHSPRTSVAWGRPRQQIPLKPRRDLFGYRNSKSLLRCSSGVERGRQQMLLERARQLYESAWSEGKVLLLDKIMAEDHAQVDRVWQATAGVGRRRMKRGILAYRAAYPDIKFIVEAAAAVPDADKVFVYWTASGTNLGNIREQPPTGKCVEFAGISLLEFNQEGQIQTSLVFRQAPADEMKYFLSTKSTTD